MSEHRPAVVIEPARREEMATAFRLLFQHLDEEDRESRVANALKMLREKPFLYSVYIIRPMVDDIVVHRCQEIHHNSFTSHGNSPLLVQAVLHFVFLCKHLVFCFY